MTGFGLELSFSDNGALIAIDWQDGRFNAI
jgi:hypothetical protein